MKWSSAIDTSPLLETAIDQAASQILADLDDQQPDLVIAFTSGRYADCHHVPELLSETFPTACVFGCAAPGVIGAGREVEDRPAVSLTAAILPGVRILGHHLDTGEVPKLYAQQRIWEDAVRMTAAQQPSFVVLSDPFGFDIETYLRGLDRTFPLAPKVGALAAAQSAHSTCLYLNNHLYHSGAITLSLTGDIELDPVVAQGCRPIADPMFVTASRDNLVLDLDGKLPRDVLAEIFERLTPQDREIFSRSLLLGVATRTDVSQYGPGDFLIRSILGVDPESGALWANMHVPVKSVVQLHLRDAPTSAYDLERTLTRARSANAHGPAAGALLFSSTARGTNLYGEPDHDSNAFRRLVADVALGGCFCSGGIGPVDATSYVHGFGSAFAVFRRRL